MSAIAEAAPETGALALYHGSQTWMHGEWRIAGACTCQRCVARALCGKPARWELAGIWGRERITCVRRESFTLYSDLPQAEAEPEHKTRTTQPSGYLEHAGVRSFDKRGRVMHDRFSFWRCTCGALGAGASRDEARSRARQHREREAARVQAGFDAAIADLRARLEWRAAS